MDVLRSWFGAGQSAMAARAAIERGEEVAVSCLVPGRRLGRWRWWRQGVLVLGDGEASWRPWPQFGRAGVPLGQAEFVRSIPVPEYELNVKRDLFSVVLLTTDSSAEESAIAVPNDDVPFVEWWLLRAHS